ncbi:MAG: glycosyltransferase [Rickettsiales bacterium]
MRIHLLHEQDDKGVPHGCSYIRLLQPFSHPSLKGKVEITTGKNIPDAVDVIILERLWLPSFNMFHARNILNEIKRRDVPFIYTLDDNLLDLNLEPGLKNFPTHEQRQIIRMFAQEANGIIVSTNPLAERMRKFNSNIHIVPNQLDERLFTKDRKMPSHQKIRFGYMGTFSHLEDLLMILYPLRAFLTRWKNKVEFEILGISEHVRTKAIFDGMPVKYHHLNKRDIHYHGFVKWMHKHIAWDFAIAPLARTPFNDGKSDLKVLDYGIFGIPGIFSDVPSYHDTVRNENGFLVPNTEEAWEQALETMATDTALRQKMAATVKQEVWETRTLAQNAWRWLDAVEKIVSQSAKKAA